MFEAIGAVDSDLAHNIAGEEHRRARVIEANDGLGMLELLTRVVFVEPDSDWFDLINFKVPDFDSAVICNACKDR